VPNGSKTSYIKKRREKKELEDLKFIRSYPAVEVYFGEISHNNNIYK